MPLTANTLLERYDAHMQAKASQLKSQGFSAQDIEDMGVKLSNIFKNQTIFDLVNEIKSEYNISYAKAKFILKNMTDTLSSDDVFNIIEPFDETTMKLVYKLHTYFAIPLEDAAKEACLLEDQEKILNSTTLIYLTKELIEIKEMSISEVANTVSKYPAITDEQLFNIGAFRVKDIASGSMTLDQVLQNTCKYGTHGYVGSDTGTQPPYGLFDYVKAFFGYKDIESADATDIDTYTKPVELVYEMDTADVSNTIE
ncbi:MAG: hypothetical protein ACK5AV_01575 [Alphaproteobacteria bacterium]